MAFEMKDYFKSYSKKGDDRVLFNVARTDDDDTAYPKFYAYQNEEGAYLIQRETTSGTLKIYGYYAKRTTSNFSTDWTNRASLSYLEYYQLFATSAT